VLAPSAGQGSTAAIGTGVLARPVGRPAHTLPALEMDQCIDGEDEDAARG